MPSILSIPESRFNTLQFELPKAGLIIDPRVMREGTALNKRIFLKARIRIKGRTLTITKRVRGNFGGEPGWEADTIFFRMYDPEIEDVPIFDSKSYTYHGLEHERAPYEVEEIVVDSSVKVIKERAFSFCTEMKRCIMGDNVERIGEIAFAHCTKMNCIRLSRGLQYIDSGAFLGCSSIDMIFVPSSVQEIDIEAFGECIAMRILTLPANINLNRIGAGIVKNCPTLFSGTDIQYLPQTNPMPPDHIWERNNHQVHRWIKQRYNHMPLIKLCADPELTASMIRGYFQDHGVDAAYETDENYNLTPLHVLASNPYASDDAILVCYAANPSAVFARDSRESTPLDYMWVQSKVNSIVHIMEDYCIHRRKNDNSNCRKRRRDDDE